MRLNLLKKAGYAAAIAVTIASLAACGSKDKGSGTEPEATSEAVADESGKEEEQTSAEPTEEPASADSLKDAFADYFSMGVAVNSWQLADPSTMDFIKKHYTSITTENEMKPEAVLDHDASVSAKDGMPVINMGNVDNIMNMAEEAGLKMRGHTLVWHSQTPEWLFHVDYDEDKDYADRDTMLARMESYISKVLTFCNEKHPGLVYAWDVVNEAMSDSEEGGLRDDSPWYITIGDDYIEKAFEFARKYAADDAKLFINDYNITYGVKCKSIYEVATKLYEKGILDGIGMQSHHDMQYFNAENLEAALFKYAQLDGLEIQLTELDLHNNDDSEAGLAAQADMYKELFNIIVKLDSEEMANITNVTFWGLNDACSWLTGFKGETSYPLMFDKNNEPKPCYYSIMDVAKEYNKN